MKKILTAAVLSVCVTIGTLSGGDVVPKNQETAVTKDSSFMGELLSKVYQYWDKIGFCNLPCTSRSWMHHDVDHTSPYHTYVDKTDGKWHTDEGLPMDEAYRKGKIVFYPEILGVKH